MDIIHQNSHDVGFMIGDDGSPTGVDGSMTGSSVDAASVSVPPAPVAPKIFRPQVIRPKATRPSPGADMLQRIAQDFLNYPPELPDVMSPPPGEYDNVMVGPPMTSIEIVNFPHGMIDDDCHSEFSTTTASTRTSSVNMNMGWGGQVNPTLGDAKKRLRARRTMSATNLTVFHDGTGSGEEEEQRFAAAPQTILARPIPIRPKPLKRTQSHGMMNQITQDFQNLPSQHIFQSQVPSCPPERAPSVAPEHQMPITHFEMSTPMPMMPPQMNMPMPQLQLPSMMMVPQPAPPRPRVRRHRSSRVKKASWYHRVAAQNKLGAIQEDPLLNMSEENNSQEKSQEGRVSPLAKSYYAQAPWDRIQSAKRELLSELNKAALDPNGTNNTPAFQAALQTLIQNYDPSLFDPRAPILAYHPYQMQLEGIGISAGKPTFPGCIGTNPQGHPMYKLGTMSFDMFRPTELVVSVQGTFCLIDSVDRHNLQELQNVPKNLQNDVRDGINPVRTYDIITPFTIEAWRPEFGEASPNRGVEQPIHGVMTTYGFLLPYPTQNRFSVWFTGGSLEVDENKNEKWFQIFDKKAAPKRTAFESGKVLAAKLLMGACVDDEMDNNGTLNYTLTRPMASHIDLVYLDHSLQVLRGKSGTCYVHVRMPGGSGAVHQSKYSDQLLPTPVDLLSNNHMLPTPPVGRF